MMIPPFRGDKRSSAGGAHRRGDFRETFKAGLTESKPILIDRLPQEFAANGAPWGINEIHQGFENANRLSGRHSHVHKDRSDGVLEHWSAGVSATWNGGILGTYEPLS